jgi:hypothetical protein
MPGFGRFNPFPFRFGGGKRAIELAHEALVVAYSQNTDTSDETIQGLEAYAEARVISQAWVASKRLGNQMVPTKMLENLPIWESVCRLQADASDSDQERRAELSGKLRGLINNAEPDIRDACIEVLGPAFVDVVYTQEADEMTYWPGVNPGMPITPWTSNVCMAWVEVTKVGMNQDVFERRVGRLMRMLDDLLPVWMGFNFFTTDTNGTDEGFILDVSLLDEAGL